jgi:hypothetical protein
MILSGIFGGISANKWGIPVIKQGTLGNAEKKTNG